MVVIVDGNWFNTDDATHTFEKVSVPVATLFRTPGGNYVLLAGGGPITLHATPASRPFREVLQFRDASSWLVANGHVAAVQTLPEFEQRRIT